MYHYLGNDNMWKVFRDRIKVLYWDEDILCSRQTVKSVRKSGEGFMIHVKRHSWRHNAPINVKPSPVPELSFHPAPYRGWTRAGERRVQDNLRAHAQNVAIFSPKSGEKPYLVVFSRFGVWRDFLNDNIQATISVFRLIKNMSINPKSVEFHLHYAKPHSIWFLSQYQR